MESGRLKLHEGLCDILGNRNAYYDPPSNTRMKYPAIRYSRKKLNIDHANNLAYIVKDCYELTLIYDDPDSELPHKLLRLPMCSHDRHYVADNLHHDVFTLYH